MAPEDFKAWSFTEEGKEGASEDLFVVKAEGNEEIGAGDLGDVLGEGIGKSEQDVQLELEEKSLTDVIKGGLFNQVLILLIITLCNIYCMYVFVCISLDICSCYYEMFGLFCYLRCVRLHRGVLCRIQSLMVISYS